MSDSERPNALGRILEVYKASHKYPVSNAQIAAEVGVSRSALGTWVQGVSMPSAQNLRSLAEHLDLPYLVLLGAVLIDAGYLVDMGYTPGSGSLAVGEE